MRVFYSWQSDRPNKTNRGLILSALQIASKAVAADSSNDIEPVVDRDTAGLPGAPDIAATIFEKIGKSDCFVADVSIINGGVGVRPCPNPNVLIEMGYAAGVLGWERIVLVVNTAFGPVEMLPFDLRARRVLAYNSMPEDEDRASIRNPLGRMLQSALREIAALHHQRRTPLTIPWPDIRVKTTVCYLLVKGASKGFVSVSVENRSPKPLFLKSVHFVLENGRSLYLPLDALTKKHQQPCRLEAGQGYTFYADPDALKGASKEARIVRACALDEIGRQFDGDEQELVLSLHGLDPSYRWC